MCQIRIFFLKAGSDKQKTKDSKRYSGEGSIKAECMRNGSWEEPGSDNSVTENSIGWPQRG